MSRLAIAIVAAWLLLASPAAAAVRPADGDWQASSMLGPWSEVVYFTVEGNGTRITNTNGLVGNPVSCGWAGRWGGAACRRDLRRLIRGPHQRGG